MVQGREIIKVKQYRGIDDEFKSGGIGEFESLLKNLVRELDTVYNTGLIQTGEEICCLSLKGKMYVKVQGQYTFKRIKKFTCYKLLVSERRRFGNVNGEGDSRV